MDNPFVGTQIHGFRSMEDLDVGNMMEEAKTRWLRPNEIYAVLCNHRHFTVRVKPVNLPPSGTTVLFDRKVLRNFRKDGHNWRKKKDGKTVKEAHEHLKVGDEERIHVYYAHGDDNPTFVRRCYWLLDKSLEHIVLVHYRETRELRGSLATPLNSNSNSNSAGHHLSSSSALQQLHYSPDTSFLDRQDSLTTKNHEQRLHEINTLEWDELLVPDDTHKMIIPPEGSTVYFKSQNQSQMNSYISDSGLSTNKASPESSADSFSEQIAGNPINYNAPGNVTYQTMGYGMLENPAVTISGQMAFSGAGSLHNQGKDGLQAQDSFGRWMANMIADSPESVDGQVLDTVLTGGDQLLMYGITDGQHPSQIGQIFNITDASPLWGLTNEETKLSIAGVFNEGYQHHSDSKLYLVCGDSILPIESVQPGVYRCLIPPQSAGVVNLYLTFDGRKPISQVLAMEFRSLVLPNKANWDEFELQMRLAHLLFSSSKSLSIFSTKISPAALREAKVFLHKTSNVFDNWQKLNSMLDTELSFLKAKERLFELTILNKLQEWLLEKVVSGNKVSERDKGGRGVIHLCAILGYAWAVHPFSCSGLSLDYRDKYGWTALHWAAYHGREKMVAALLSGGAKPHLVTDPTPKFPGGRTAADLATANGYEGLGAYLAKEGLVAQLNDMTLAGNVSGSLQTTTNDDKGNPGNFTEEELALKDSLAAYRTAADAAARIQTAFREHSLKVRTNMVKELSQEEEARNIVAAMKIQHAFRNHEIRKKINAAARIQCRFRGWKIRKDFLNMRRQAIRIQSHFRGYQVRKEYQKIVWSVGVLEKAILRWRLKRKGFRGLEVKTEGSVEDPDPNQEGGVEEDFFQASRKQAEERVERSVGSVQAMFHSKQAQEDYRRMKLEHDKVKLEYEGLLHPDEDMG